MPAGLEAVSEGRGDGGIHYQNMKDLEAEPGQSGRIKGRVERSRRCIVSIYNTVQTQIIVGLVHVLNRL